jgi:chromosome segregation ATPase
MSALAKIFVVFVFLLSVFFFGSSAVLFKTRTDWRKAYNRLEKEVRTELATLKKKNDEVTAAWDKQEQTIVSHKAAEDQLGKDLKQKISDLNEEKGKVTLANSQAEKTNVLNTTLTAALEKVNTQNKQLQDALEKANTALDEATKIADTANQQRDIMRLDLAGVQADLHAARTELTSLMDEYETVKMNLDAVAAVSGGNGAGTTPARPIDALINAVDNEEKLVVISAGKEQKVEPGYEFTVFRGDQFIGKVKVIKVFPDLAGARILWTKEGREIQRGDKASTFVATASGG